LERATGIEPVTSSLGSWHSTAELRPLRTWQKSFIWNYGRLSMSSARLSKQIASCDQSAALRREKTVVYFPRNREKPLC
jgi:hypothetical protein